MPLISAEVWGAGGGGGGVSIAGGVADGGGGGGGAYSKKALTIINGNSYTVTVGSGGVKGDGAGTINGAAGGDSWFQTSGTVLAKGGSGGTGGPSNGTDGVGGTGGIAGSGIGDTTFSGGTGSNGFRTNGNATANGGGGGGAAGSVGNGGSSSGSLTGGAGNGTNSGNGGNGGSTTAGTVAGNVGNNFGAGGAGGAAASVSSTTTGGNGAGGLVVISYPTGTMTATGGVVTVVGGTTFNTFSATGTLVVGPLVLSDSLMNADSRLATLASFPFFASPIISVRQTVSPYNVISSLVYQKTSNAGTILPVLDNEQSDPISFRIYNNFGKTPNVVDAINVHVTTYDGASHTASMAVASQSWLHIIQSGFGEGSSGPALYTAFTGVDETVGGSSNVYYFDFASNGNPNISEIRSNSNYQGTGFLEAATYIQPKSGTVGQLNNFVVTIHYEYMN